LAAALDTSRNFFTKFKFEDIVIPKRLKKQGEIEARFQNDSLMIYR